MQGGHHPDLPSEWYEVLLRSFKEKFPRLHVHAFSPPEIQHIVKVSRRPLEEVLRRLKAAGLDSIPGGGGEILVDEVGRKILPIKTVSEDWLAVMEYAQLLGMTTKASMMFCHVEFFDDLVGRLLSFRGCHV